MNGIEAIHQQNDITRKRLLRFFDSHSMFVSTLLLPDNQLQVMNQQHHCKPIRTHIQGQAPIT